MLLNIARGFHLLINSEESLNLHRLIMTQGSQDPKLSQIFVDERDAYMTNALHKLLGGHTEAKRFVTFIRYLF